MSIDLEFDGSVDQLDEGLVDIAGDRLEKAQVTLKQDLMPERANHRFAAVSVRLTISDEQLGVQRRVSPHESIIEAKGEITTEYEDQKQIILEDVGHISGTELSTSFPDWLDADGEQCYITVRVWYDERRTVATADRTPRELERLTSVRNYTTPGVRSERYYGVTGVEMGRFTNAAIVSEVFAAAYQTDVRTYAATGFDTRTREYRWKAPLQFSSENTQIAVPSDTVYLAPDNVYAVDAQSGDIKWTVEMPGDRNTSFAVCQETVFTVGEHNHLLALDPSTGAERWRRKIQSGPKVGVAIDEEVQSVCVNDGDEETIHAFGTSTGHEMLSYEVEGKITTPIAAGGGRAFVVADIHETEEHEFGERSWVARRVAYGIELSSDEDQWMIELPNTVRVSPVVTDELLLCADIKGGIHALDVATGEIRWSKRVESGFSRTQPLVTEDGIVYLIGTNEDESSNLAYALDIETGELQWRYQLPLGFDQKPAVSEDTLWVPTADRATGEGTIYAIEPTDSTRLPLSGEIQTLDDATAKFEMSANDTPAGTLDISARELPYYGRFEGARFELFLALGREYEAISGDPQRDSSLITEFEGSRLLDPFVDDSVVYITVFGPPIWTHSVGWRCLLGHGILPNVGKYNNSRDSKLVFSPSDRGKSFIREWPWIRIYAHHPASVLHSIPTHHPASVLSQSQF
jgi:outer membrane protein assembly factor BamB